MLRHAVHVTPHGLEEDFEGLHKVFTDLLVMALACDLTRVLSLEFTGAQCNTLMWPVNLLEASTITPTAAATPTPTCSTSPSSR